jgi:hypothetical protein
METSSFGNLSKLFSQGVVLFFNSKQNKANIEKKSVNQ